MHSTVGIIQYVACTIQIFLGGDSQIVEDHFITNYNVKKKVWHYHDIVDHGCTWIRLSHL